MKNEELTLHQEAFCRYYTSKGAFFDNATLAYAEAYEYELPKDEKGKIKQDSSEYNTCSACGSRLLANAKIKEKIKELWLEQFTADNMDARTAEIALKGKDADSIQAIKIHNDLKQRITKKLDITTLGRPLSGLSDDELQELAG